MVECMKTIVIQTQTTVSGGLFEMLMNTFTDGHTNIWTEEYTDIWLDGPTLFQRRDEDYKNTKDAWQKKNMILYRGCLDQGRGRLQQNCFKFMITMT